MIVFTKECNHCFQSSGAPTVLKKKKGSNSLIHANFKKKFLIYVLLALDMLLLELTRIHTLFKFKFLYSFHNNEQCLIYDV